MDEYVSALVLGNEPIALLIVEPFDGTSCHVEHPPDMGERYAATAARRRLKTALASVYPYAVPYNLTEIMRTAVDFETTAQPISFRSGSQEGWPKFCKMQLWKVLPAAYKCANFTGVMLRNCRPRR